MPRDRIAPADTGIFSVILSTWQAGVFVVLSHDVEELAVRASGLESAWVGLSALVFGHDLDKVLSLTSRDRQPATS